jgi:hypothetical protein
LGFCRSHQDKTLRVYTNRSRNSWDIPSGRILFGHNIRTVAPTWMTLSPMGFCILEEE